MDLTELKTFPGGAWLLDTEYATPTGDPVIPVCLVGREFFSGESVRLWFEPGQSYKNPFPGDEALYVSYSAQSEWSVFLQLGWKLPLHIIDLHSEFRNEICGRTPPPGFKEWDTRLQSAMAYYGLDQLVAREKEALQKRISRGFPFTQEELPKILDYCEKDIVCLLHLLPAMAPDIDLPYARFRGVHSRAVARIELNGIPIDRVSYDRVAQNRNRLKSLFVDRYESQHGPAPFVKNKRGVSFNFLRYGEVLAKLGLLSAWETTTTGRLVSREEYLSEMAVDFPVAQPLADLLKRVKDLQDLKLAIGRDDRSRYPVLPFKADTGRNQPPSKRFLFAKSAWTRAFIRPAPGQAIAGIDWSCAEFCIAGCLSGDTVMQADYESGDPYMAAAKAAGFVGPTATKSTDPVIRDVLKIWLLSAQYGATANSLVRALPLKLRENFLHPQAMAEDFLEKHQRLYSRYWNWAEGRVEIFMHETQIEETCFGWRHRLNPRLSDWKIRTQALNWPIQSACAEILRWSTVFVTEEGIELIAPLHDQLFVAGPEGEIEEIVQRTRACMDRASVLVIGTAMRTDAGIVRHPERLMEPRGRETWNFIMQSLDEIESRPALQPILESDSQSRGGRIWEQQSNTF